MLSKILLAIIWSIVGVDNDFSDYGIDYIGVLFVVKCAVSAYDYYNDPDAVEAALRESEDEFDQFFGWLIPLIRKYSKHPDDV